MASCLALRTCRTSFPALSTGLAYAASRPLTTAHEPPHNRRESARLPLRLTHGSIAWLAIRWRACPASLLLSRSIGGSLTSNLPTERPAALLRLDHPSRLSDRLAGPLAGLSGGHSSSQWRRNGSPGCSFRCWQPRLTLATWGSGNRGQVRDFAASGRGTEDALAIVLSRHARAASWRAWCIVPQFRSSAPHSSLPSSSALPISVGLPQMLGSRLLPARTCSR